MHTIATVLAVVFGLHILLKFAFFTQPYRQRRAQLDKAYGDRLSATHSSDLVLLTVTGGLAVVLFVAGVDPTSFLIGLWVGATLIQLYFHQFHEPLSADATPRAPAGPIKVMSYAIQASPWRPWPEIALLSILVVASLVALIT